MQQRKMTNLQLTTLAASIALLLVSLLMPLVALMSYRWGLGEVLAKMPRLVHSGGTQVVGYVLLAVMVLSPALLAVRSWFSRRPLWVVRLLPVAGSLLLVAALLLSSKPVAPAVGLWVYLALALMLAVSPTLMPERNAPTPLLGSYNDCSDAGSVGSYNGGSDAGSVGSYNGCSDAGSVGSYNDCSDAGSGGSYSGGSYGGGVD